MNADSPCFSKNSDEWETPQWLFEKIQQDYQYEFKFDAAATHENSKCGSWYADKIGDSLKLNWDIHACGCPIWLNPPYSQIGEFIKKAYYEHLKAVPIVCLIPSRTDTRWWHEYVMKSAMIVFIKGRLKFGDSKNSAPFPSCIVFFDENRMGEHGPAARSMEGKP